MSQDESLMSGDDNLGGRSALKLEQSSVQQEMAVWRERRKEGRREGGREERRSLCRRRQVNLI